MSFRANFLPTVCRVPSLFVVVSFSEAIRYSYSGMLHCCTGLKSRGMVAFVDFPVSSRGAWRVRYFDRAQHVATVNVKGKRYKFFADIELCKWKKGRVRTEGAGVAGGTVLRWICPLRNVGSL